MINPDDSVVIRIAKSEMGQGTLTGLAQLTAEELGCDWSKVSRNEFPPPQNVARKRVWGDYFTAGSRASAPRRNSCARAALRRARC